MLFIAVKSGLFCKTLWVNKYEGPIHGSAAAESESQKENQ